MNMRANRQVKTSGMEKMLAGGGGWERAGEVGEGGVGAAHPSLPVTDKAARHKRQLIPLLLNC